jgi:hypothetical protein
MFFILAPRSINYSLRIITRAKSLIPEEIFGQEAAGGAADAYSGVAVIARLSAAKDARHHRRPACPEDH